MFINFQLLPRPELCDLRQAIWDRIFQLYQTALKEDALDVLCSYSRSGDMVSVNPIIADDASVVLPFIQSAMDPTNYRHCSVVQDFLDLLDDSQISYPKDLRDRFRSETYILGELILSDRAERRNLKLGHGEYRRYKHEQITEHFTDYSLPDYKRFFDQCTDIQKELNKTHEELRLRDAVVTVLSALADRNPSLYTDVLRHYLLLGDRLRINCPLLVDRLVNAYGVKATYELINGFEYPTKRRWIFDFYQCLPVEEITSEHVNQLYGLYRDSEREEIPYYFDFLLKYRPLDARIVAQITRIILEKVEANPDYAYSLSSLFHPNNDTNKGLSDFFERDLDLLKRAYIAVLATDQHADHDGQAFGRILDLDRHFVLEYIDQIYKQGKRPTRHEDTRDYSFLWQRHDCEVLMTWIVESIYNREREKVTFWSSYTEVFFGISEDSEDNPKTRERQDRFLEGLIKRRYNELEFMEFLFSLIAKFAPERKRPFVVLFLQHNRNFNDFESVALDSNMWSWSGSAVPTLQGRVEYFESLLPYLNTVELLQHKQYVERRIQGLRSEIEWEKKKDFMED